MTPFFRTDPLLYHKFENMEIFGQETYIHFAAQETKIIRKLFFFIIHNNAKVVVLLELAVIISTFFDEKLQKINHCLTMLVSWAKTLSDRNITVFPNLWYKSTYYKNSVNAFFN